MGVITAPEMLLGIVPGMDGKCFEIHKPSE